MAGYIDRVAGEIAALIAREGLDYLQTKAVFKAARQRAGLVAPKARRGAPARLSLEEELRFIDHAYARGGPVGLMMQTLLETGARVSEFVALRVEDVSLAERIVTIAEGKGGKRREVPIRLELARLLALHIGKRRAGPLFPSRETGSGPHPYVYTRQRIGQVVREVAAAAGIGNPVRCIHVGDRESDIYELFCLAQELGTHFLVRTCVDRLALGGDTTVDAVMDEVAVQGVHAVAVRDAKGRLGTAEVELTYRSLRILPPIGKQKHYPALTLTVLHAREREAPADRPRIDWKLLTDLPVLTQEGAIEKLRWYRFDGKSKCFTRY